MLHDRGPQGQWTLRAAMELDPSVLVALLDLLEERGLITVGGPPPTGASTP
jgi:DNA-binding MarR family transcriptional regulator